ncbi:hypothetical protein M422DRAFT_244206, partial [Sphaerobolus stellatus SS14]
HVRQSLSNIYGKADDEQSKELLRHAIKLGLTFWDTYVHVVNLNELQRVILDDSADIYGNGHNEKLIGSVLQEGDNRSKVFLATKFSHVFDEETGKATGEIQCFRIGDAAYIRQAIEASIKRLGTTPDLYYQHRVDVRVPIEETYSTLEELRKEGKIKYIGISEPSVESLRKAAKVAKITALQIEYSPWTTDIERNGLLAAARELGITIVAYSPLGRGFLTGRYKSVSELEASDRRLAHPRFQEENFVKNLHVVEKIQAIADKKGVTPAQLCLAWVAAQGEDIIPIPGTKSISRLEENWKSRDIQLTADELKEMREVIDNANIAGERCAFLLTYTAYPASTPTWHDRYPASNMKHIGK